MKPSDKLFDSDLLTSIISNETRTSVKYVLLSLFAFAPYHGVIANRTLMRLTGVKSEDLDKVLNYLESKSFIMRFDSEISLGSIFFDVTRNTLSEARTQKNRQRFIENHLIQELEFKLEDYNEDEKEYEWISKLLEHIKT